MIRSAIAGVLCATLTLGCVEEAADASSTTGTDKTVTSKTAASVAVKPTWIVYTYDG